MLCTSLFAFSLMNPYRFLQQNIKYVRRPPLAATLSSFHSQQCIQPTILPGSLHQFSNTPSRHEEYYFDSFKLVEHLERKGFSREQSCAVMTALQNVLSESMKDLASSRVTKAEFNKTMYARTVDFVQLQSEMQVMDRNAYDLMRTENQRLEGELDKLRQKLQEEIIRTQANVRVEMHLEKGRFRDETSAQQIKITETDTRIESELAGLRTQMEAIKFQILQYFIGTLTGGGALFLAYLRMLR